MSKLLTLLFFQSNRSYQLKEIFGGCQKEFVLVRFKASNLSPTQTPKKLNEIPEFSPKPRFVFMAQVQFCKAQAEK
jgi:hypothetical protein